MKQIIGLLLIAIPVASALIGWIVTTAMKHGIVAVADVQRCTQHKLRNLLDACPKHAHPELKRDYHTVIGAKNHKEGLAAFDRFLTKWKSLCPAVATSLEEAGLELISFYRFPKPLWKGLRTTNSLEHLNREFRRRTKTQGSFGTEKAALTLLYALVAFGQITLRKITGYQHVAEIEHVIENAA